MWENRESGVETGAEEVVEGNPELSEDERKRLGQLVVGAMEGGDVDAVVDGHEEENVKEGDEGGGEELSEGDIKSIVEHAVDYASEDEVRDNASLLHKLGVEPGIMWHKLESSRREYEYYNEEEGSEDKLFDNLRVLMEAGYSQEDLIKEIGAREVERLGVERFLDSGISSEIVLGTVSPEYILGNLSVFNKRGIPIDTEGMVGKYLKGGIDRNNFRFLLNNREKIEENGCKLDFSDLFSRISRGDVGWRASERDINMFINAGINPEAIFSAYMSKSHTYGDCVDVCEYFLRKGLLPEDYVYEHTPKGVLGLIKPPKGVSGLLNYLLKNSK